MRFAELPVSSKSGRGLIVENAVIDSVSISNGDHGCLTAWVTFSFDGGGCGFGGYMLGRASGGNLDAAGNFAAEWIVRCLNAIGETEWESLKGRPARVLHEGWGGRIVAIGHFIKDEWFCPQIEFEKGGQS